MTPDKWVVLQFKSEKSEYYKILSTWYGGYVGGDNWRVSSGILKVEDKGEYYDVLTTSLSEYKLNKSSEGMSNLGSAILEQAKNGAKAQNVEVEINSMTEAMEKL